MRIAILIGVPTYDSVANLPACANDLELMQGIIERTARYDDMLAIQGDTASAAVKLELSKFVKKHMADTIDEVFFYYTGHGEFSAGDFRFIFSDYTPSKHKQTTLSNDELDEMLRSLSPALTVKFVDACHAGVPYVKDTSALQDFLQKSTGEYKNCYFCYSSHAEEQSFQDSQFSAFTKSFAQACLAFSGRDIRFRDIMDLIADDFAGNSIQTPYFVIQAPCVEIFCAISQSLDEFISDQLTPTSPDANPSAVSTAQPSLVDLVKADAAGFCTKEEVATFLGEYAQKTVAYEPSSEMSQMFTVRFEVHDQDDGIEKTVAIGKWLAERDTEYFAEPVYGPASTEASIFGSVLGVTGGSKKARPIAGFAVTADCPWRSITISAMPLFENLDAYKATITCVFSKTECVFFNRFSVLKETKWGSYREAEPAKWGFWRVAMKKDLEALDSAGRALRGFENFVQTSVKRKFGVTDDKDQPEASTPSTEDDEESEDGAAS